MFPLHLAWPACSCSDTFFSAMLWKMAPHAYERCLRALSPWRIGSAGGPEGTAGMPQPDASKRALAGAGRLGLTGALFVLGSVFSAPGCASDSSFGDHETTVASSATEEPNDASALAPPSEICTLELSPGDGYAVPLRVHLSRSGLSHEALCDILREMNAIWWEQARVCFDVQVTTGDEVSGEGLDFWFERDSPLSIGVDANGVYTGAHGIYALDAPSLTWAEPASAIPAARTAAHELGHALGLPHQNCGGECDGLLMRSGTRGIRIVEGPPAGMDEISVAQNGATLISGGRALSAAQRCVVQSGMP